MARHRIEYLDAAWRDISGIADYHLKMAGTVSAERITDRILDEIDRLADYPWMAPIHPDPVLAAQGYRKLALNRTYVAVYKVLDDVVYIYRIVNGAIDYPKLLI